MTNTNKAKGTQLESGFVRWWNAATGQQAYRAALHGSGDVGDVHGVTVNGRRVAVECKAHRVVTPALLREFRHQTLVERGNAGTDVGVLVLHRTGCDATGRSPSFAANDLELTASALLTLLGLVPGVTWPGDAEGPWLRMTVGDLARLAGWEGPDD